MLKFVAWTSVLVGRPAWGARVVGAARRHAREKFFAEQDEPSEVATRVVGYNMARELPRTVRSLSAAHQRDIAEDDYEVIVIDNGSTQAFELEQLQRLGIEFAQHSK